MVIPFVAEPGVTRRLVPEPLEPNPDDLAYVAIGHMHNDKLGSTHEAFVVVPSSDGARGQLLGLPLPRERRLRDIRAARSGGGRRSWRDLVRRGR